KARPLALAAIPNFRFACPSGQARPCLAHCGLRPARTIDLYLVTLKRLSLRPIGKRAFNAMPPAIAISAEAGRLGAGARPPLACNPSSCGPQDQPPKRDAR